LVNQVSQPRYNVETRIDIHCEPLPRTGGPDVRETVKYLDVGATGTYWTEEHRRDSANGRSAISDPARRSIEDGAVK
jgi:hypothetical protein